MSRLPSRHLLRDAALNAAARGWRVFPIKPGGTEPAVQDWQQKATSDPERITRAWQYGPYNIGVMPCASRLLVVDLVPARLGERPPRRFQGPGVHDGADVLAALTEDAGARFPTETFTVGTPQSGMALYFTHPQGPCPVSSPGSDSRLGWHVSIRSTDCYVLLPGSTTTDGAFTVMHDAPAAAWPDYLAARLPARPTSCECTTTSGEPLLSEQESLPR